MKIVFFRQLLLDDTTKLWTASQQIVYSYLLSQSVLRLDCVFGVDGETIDYKLAEVADEYSDNGMIDLCDFKVGKICRTLNISRQNIYNAIDFLRSAGYIQDELIRCPKEIISHGYFELQTDTKITKQLLIFYSWLYERASFHDGMLDTFSYKMADLFGTSEENIRAMLSRLADKGFVQRIATKDRRYGKLLIKQ